MKCQIDGIYLIYFIIIYNIMNYDYYNSFINNIIEIDSPQLVLIITCFMLFILSNISINVSFTIKYN